MVVHILRQIKHPLVDAEEELRLLRVTDDSLGKSDASVIILRVFAAEDFTHVGCDAAADDELLHSRADDVVLDVDSVGLVLGGEKTFLQLLEHLRNPRKKTQLRPEFTQVGVGWAVQFEVIEQGFQISQFVLEAVLLHQLMAALPELFPVDSEVGKNGFLLHVGRTEGLVVIVNDGDGALRDRHGKAGALGSY